jgi:hypothetical protein
MVFTPAGPFKCSHILIWFSKELTIKQVSIGREVQLVQPTPGQVFAAPVTLDIIENWFKNCLLGYYLQEHHIWPIELPVADPIRPITIEFDGAFDIIALTGAQLIEVKINGH